MLFHILVSTSTLYFAEKYYPKHELTQIEIVEPEAESLEQKLQKTRQMIKQLKTTVEQIKDSKEMARFESEKTQRVAQETKSNNIGVTQNSSVPIKSQIPQKTQPEKDDGDLPEFTISKPNVQQVPVVQKSSISTTLPSDISNSNSTNLNTDASTYYSFYSRVEDLFYVRWVERVRFYWERINYDYKKRVLSGKVWSSSVEIWLTEKGEYHSAYIRQSSGYRAFDEAAIFAFKDARFFPNPPRAKVEPDGFVRLRYRFNVHVPEYSAN